MSNQNELAVAIHEIETVQNGKPKIVTPGTVFPIDSKNHADLKKLGALRDPSEAEVALYEKTQPKASVKAEAGEGEGEGAGNGTKGRGKAKAGASGDIV